MKMKYRNLMPLVMALMMFVAIYSMVSNAQSKQAAVTQLVTKAQECSKQGLYDKAANYYSEAINEQEALDLYLAAADMYYDAQRYEDSYNWGEKVVAAYPKEAAAYERMIRACLAKEAYSDAYTTLAAYDGRKLSSETVEQYRKDMEFLLWEDGKSYNSVTTYSGGYIAFENKGKWGLASEKGSTKVKAQFAKVGYFANGMVAVLDSENNWYFMNEDGEYIHNISLLVGGTITDVGLYSNELFPVCKDGKYSYYNLSFQKVFGEYDYAGSFSGGLAAVKKGNTWQIIDSSGNSIDGKEYLDVILDDRGVCCQKERMFAKIGDYEYIMLDKSGARIGTETFEGAKLFANGKYAAIMRSGMWGFVDLQGVTFMEPKFDNANSFSMDLAAVCEGDKWGYIDTQGTQVIEPKYLECLNFTTKGTVFAKTSNGINIIKLYKYNY